MHKTFIFDCGNVLIGFSKDRLLDRYVGGDSKDRELMESILFGHWEEQDRGKPSRQFYEEMKTLLPKRLHKAAYGIIFHWKENTWPIEGMEKLVEALKSSGHRLILLSNMPDDFTYDHDDIPVLKHFDELIFSFPLKMAKPSEEFFKYAIGKCGLNPKDCIFIDDNLGNIETAKSLGFDTFLFNRDKADDFIGKISREERLNAN